MVYILKPDGSSNIVSAEEILRGAGVRAPDRAKKPVSLEDLSLAAFGANAGGVEGGDSDQYGIEEAARLYGVPDPSKG